MTRPSETSLSIPLMAEVLVVLALLVSIAVRVAVLAVAVGSAG